MNILNRPVSRGEKLRQMQAFTNLYRTFPETEPYQREVACLRTQFSFIPVSYTHLTLPTICSV